MYAELDHLYPPKQDRNTPLNLAGAEHPKTFASPFPRRSWRKTHEPNSAKPCRAEPQRQIAQKLCSRSHGRHVIWDLRYAVCPAFQEFVSHAVTPKHRHDALRRQCRKIASEHFESARLRARLRCIHGQCLKATCALQEAPPSNFREGLLPTPNHSSVLEYLPCGGSTDIDLISPAHCRHQAEELEATTQPEPELGSCRMDASRTGFNGLASK